MDQGDNRLIPFARCVQLHAIETLAQLIKPNVIGWSAVLGSCSNLTVSYAVAAPVQINDQPRFPFRGLMVRCRDQSSLPVPCLTSPTRSYYSKVDVARHWYPLSELLRLVDMMTFLHLNTLQVHLTDAQSFPIVFPSHSEFAAAGAYHPSAMYVLRPWDLPIDRVSWDLPLESVPPQPGVRTLISPRTPARSFHHTDRTPATRLMICARCSRTRSCAASAQSLNSMCPVTRPQLAPQIPR